MAAHQLLPLLRERCHIIHDGVDLDRFRQNQIGTKGSQDHYLRNKGYGTHSGISQFIQSLPGVLKTNPSAVVEIAGEDSINYGGHAPKGHKSWGQWAKRLLSEAAVGERVKWMGYLDANEYVNWLQNSQCHVHLSHPFVASWSLLEALACECPMVVSDVAPVRELCEGTNSRVRFVDHRDPGAITKSIEKTLDNPDRHEGVAVKPTMNSYSTCYSLEQWGLWPACS